MKRGKLTKHTPKTTFRCVYRGSQSEKLSPAHLLCVQEVASSVEAQFQNHFL